MSRLAFKRNQKKRPNNIAGEITAVNPIHSFVTVLSPVTNSSASAVFTVKMRVGQGLDAIF
jgi:hypothetical protein